MDGVSWAEAMSDFLESSLGAMIEAGVYAGLLAIVVLGINLLFRRWLTAGQMGLMWGLVLLRLVVPVVPGSALSLERLVWSNSAEPAVALAAQPDLQPVLAAGVPDVVEQLTALNLPVAQPEPKTSWMETLLWATPFVWLFGGALGLMWTVARYARFVRCVRRQPECTDGRLLRLWAESCEFAGVRYARRVVQFDGIEQPAIMGMLRPTLLLPNDADELEDEQLRMIMLHELAHVRRWDTATNWLLLLIRAIHWWNPVYWLAAARFRSLREQACDAFVVRRMNHPSTQDYGTLLLALVARRPNGPTWRVMLPASILSFFPSVFRRRAIRVRLKSLQRAGVKYGRWQMAGVAAMLTALVVSGFTTANEPEVQPVDLPTWMASNSAAVLSPVQPKWGEEDCNPPREWREYQIGRCLELLGRQGASDEEARQVLEAAMKMFIFRMLPGETTLQVLDPPLYSIDGTTLRVVAPVALHERLKRTLEAWNESGLTQIAVQTRFLSANRDLVSELGISWEFLEAFSSERRSTFPVASREGAPVVRAESRVDEYFPLVVSTLSREQSAKLVEIAQLDARTNVLQAPKVTFMNGTEATIADCTKRPFVVGVFQRQAGANEPKVVVLEEGTRINVRAKQLHDCFKVHLEASLDMTSLAEVTTASTSYRGGEVSIQVPSVKRRSIDVADTLEDGQTLLVGCIPTAKEQKFMYILLSAEVIGVESVQ